MNSNVVKKGGNGEDRTGDCNSRQATINAIKKRLFETALNNAGVKQDIDETLMDVAENRLENWFDELPPAQPELDIWNDGTLHISVSKGQLDKIGRVLVEEDGTIFCKLFYQDADERRVVKRNEWWNYSQRV